MLIAVSYFAGAIMHLTNETYVVEPVKRKSDKHHDMATVQDIYLDLLKRVLTDTVYGVEPDLENSSSSEFLTDFIRHYIRGSAISMLPLARFDNLHSCIRQVIDDNVPGDLIETGVWRGGAVIFMRAALKAYGVIDRQVWVANSFEGLPEPDAEKYPLEAAAYHGVVQSKVMNHLAASIEDVRVNFQKFGLLDEQVGFLKGWFKDTLPLASIDRLAILRLDGDYYKSTMDALDALYHKVSIGGFVIVDDFGEESWTYCKKATEEFRSKHNIKDPLIRVDPSCYYWRRSH